MTGSERSAEVDEPLLEAIEERTEPEPDGVQDATGNIWTGHTRLKQEASKGNVPCERDGVRQAVDRLRQQDRVVTYHGLLAPANDEHLTAIIENERQAGVTRSELVKKCNRLIHGGATADA